MVCGRYSKQVSAKSQNVEMGPPTGATVFCGDGNWHSATSMCCRWNVRGAQCMSAEETLFASGGV